jgi:hypothetical protein
MGLFDIFRKPAPVRTAADLEDFLDSRAAFLVQKCVYEYSRARAGILWQKLFREEGFRRAVERSSWQNYEIGLGNVALMVDATLRPHLAGGSDAFREGLKTLAENVTDRHPIPEGFDGRFWPDARERVARRIDQAGLAAPKAVKDIPQEMAERFFEALPIHESLRGHDFVLVSNNLRLNLCSMHEDLLKRCDPPALAEAVAEAAPAGAATG